MKIVFGFSDIASVFAELRKPFMKKCMTAQKTADERFTLQYYLYAGIHGTGVFDNEKIQYDLMAYVRHRIYGKPQI